MQLQGEDWLIRFDDERREFTIGVGSLAERIVSSEQPLKRRLGWALTPMHALRLGRSTHAFWQQERAAESSFESEKRLERRVAVGAWTAIVQGRTDGVSLEGEKVCVEELKTTALSASALLDTTADAWLPYVAQLQVYLWMHAGSDVSGRLIIVSLLDGSRHSIGVGLPMSFAGRVLEELEALALERDRLLHWMRERAHVALAWPYPGWRPGQRNVCDSLAEGIQHRRIGVLEAPTGSGKTDAVLFAAMQVALRQGKRIYWATARTTQQTGIEAAVRRLKASYPGIRSVTLGARRRICLRSTVDCRPSVCSSAREFVRRLRTQHPLQHQTEVVWSASDLREFGLQKDLCPQDLGLEVAKECDVVVGDYHHVMEGRPAFWSDCPEDWILIVDEVHQLPQRMRDARSPTITDRMLASALAVSTKGSAFEELVLEVAGLFRATCGQTISDVGVDGLVEVRTSLQTWHDLAQRFDGLLFDYLRQRGDDVSEEEDFWLAVGRAVSAFAQLLSESVPSRKLVARGSVELTLLTLDASKETASRLSEFWACVGLSATVKPLNLLLAGLGVADLQHHRLPPSFPPENSRIIVASRVSTAWADRESQAPETARLMERCIQEIPGSTAVYFPSYRAMNEIMPRWKIMNRPVFSQRADMNDLERETMLSEFVRAERAVLCAVLGGVFAEGIDLPPGALSGVLVYGPGFPPIGLRLSLLSEWYERTVGRGFHCASTVPGVTRVIQAAGRLHRRADDRGVVVLFDRRFQWREVVELFPEHWSPVTPEDPVRSIAEFWSAS